VARTRRPSQTSPQRHHPRRLGDSWLTLLRVRRDERAEPPAVRSLWRRSESTSELLAIDMFECPSVKGAHDQLLEALGNVESGAVERQTGRRLSAMSPSRLARRWCYSLGPMWSS